ncbi:MAG: hypothetical protein ABIX01_17170 [Chitinophagaceae bacterium]
MTTRNNKLIAFACILVTLIFQSLRSQAQGLPCGNGHIDTAADIKAMAYMAGPQIKGLQTVTYLVRVYFHVFNNNDGSNTACSPAQVKTEFASLLATYASDNICFINCGSEYINNTVINTTFNADDDSNGDAFAPYQVPNCINIFYLRTIKGNNTACNPPCGYGGIALGGIPGTFFLVASGNIGLGSTIGHEMGHCFGLLHTFETAHGYEKINGSNGSSSGDKVTDTPADPFAYNGQACYGTNNCQYFGYCADPNGATNFSPPYTNLMSYWWGLRNAGNNFCFPNQVTTNGQFTRVNSFLNTDGDLQSCSSPSLLNISNLNIGLGHYMRSAIGFLTTTSTVSFYAVAEATLAADVVTLNPGFIAAPSTGGLVQILTKPCQ